MRKISPNAPSHLPHRDEAPHDHERPARNTAAPHADDDTRVLLSSWDTPLVPEA